MLFNKIYVSQKKADAVSQVEGFDFWSRDMSIPIARTFTTPNKQKSQGDAGNLTSFSGVNSKYVKDLRASFQSIAEIACKIKKSELPDVTKVSTIVVLVL